MGCFDLGDEAFKAVGSKLCALVGDDSGPSLGVGTFKRHLLDDHLEEALAMFDAQKRFHFSTIT